eukprot:gnl/TRDRNA2_/TRDRNA2_169168_c1_seq1.p1 gnl/TRDRNA2_/TRDRNA2_169168_c1~~gnl/TRDRNA2_/TRDRNA2_169168_c1_seq1.p1  ORF type:complete len:133 (-),score=22.67 gnl/TRDRNA2_/TRDRNA2_169168_c1_seq1:39-437(-)
MHFGGTFATEGMLAAYSMGRPWLRGAKSYIEEQILRCEKFLQTRCAPEVVPLRPEATYLLWLDCRGLNVQDPARFFREEAGVVLSPGAEFGGEATAHFARLNVATSTEVIDRALQQIAAAIERRRVEVRASL